MANRFVSPEQQFISNTGQPYAGGSLFFFVTGTTTPATTYQDVGLTIPNTNPIVLDSAGNAGNIFLNPAVTYKVQLNDANANLIWTFDPVIPTDSQTSTGVTQVVPCSAVGTNAITLTPLAPSQQPSAYTNYQVFSFVPPATTTGAVTAGVGALAQLPVFLAPGIQAGAQTFLANAGPYFIAYGSLVNGGSNPGFELVNTNVLQAVQASIPVVEGQGYLTPVSNTPIITADAIAATIIYYTPFKGLGNPIHNGTSIIPYLLSGQLSLTLTTAQVASNIYDVFLAYNNGSPVIGTGPSWLAGTGGSITSGSCARGTGAGGSSLARLQGIWTNAVSMTLTYNTGSGNNSLAVPANQGVYLGSLFIDASAGQVTCHRSYGQNRKWGIWNNFNRQKLTIVAGDSTATWAYNTNALRAANGSNGNAATYIIGLPEETITFSTTAYVTSGALSASQTTGGLIAIGYNSSTVASGQSGSITYSAGATTVYDFPLFAGYTAPPLLGVSSGIALENGLGLTSVTWNGTQKYMQFTAIYCG